MWFALGCTDELSNHGAAWLGAGLGLAMAQIPDKVEGNYPRTEPHLSSEDNTRGFRSHD